MIENLHEQLAASVERMRKQFPGADVRAGFEVQWTKDRTPRAFAEREQFCVGVALVPSMAHEYGFGETLATAEAYLLTRLSLDHARAKITQLRTQAEALERALRGEVAA